MNSKILFMIIGEEVKYLTDSDMDHREWYNSLGLDPNNYDNIIRGFVMDGKIVFFKGMNFNYDKEVLDAAKKYASRMRFSLKNESLSVCCGIVINSAGEKWEPIVTLNENELTATTVQPKNEEVKVVVPKEVGPMIEFKNNYEDPNFIKRAVLITIVVLILSVVVKFYLISTMTMHLNRMFDFLLIIGQVVLLILTILGYKRKSVNAKFFGIAASICLVLTFDIFDIILGVLYFLFSVDQGYFIKLIDTIKKIKIKKDK